jgi:hypothetical protein
MIFPGGDVFICNLKIIIPVQFAWFNAGCLGKFIPSIAMIQSASLLTAQIGIFKNGIAKDTSEYSRPGCLTMVSHNQGVLYDAVDTWM